MDAILERFASSSDMGHMGLLFWAVGASVLLLRTLRLLDAANQRFDAFVRELARFNRRHEGGET